MILRGCGPFAFAPRLIRREPPKLASLTEEGLALSGTLTEAEDDALETHRALRALNHAIKTNTNAYVIAEDSSILPGITRKSCVELLRDWGYEVQERLLSVDELFEAAASGALEEAWGTGTAAVISPIGEIIYQGKEYVIGGFNIGELTQKLYDTVTGIQWGRLKDTFGWVEPVC
mgnify:CR=1 FL=1